MTKRAPSDFDHSLPGEWTLRFRPMARIPGNPFNRWRKRAAEIRALAEQMQDQWIKGALLRLAADYDQQAEEAEKRVPRSAGTTTGRLDARGRRASR
jgi:hypothetical protein